MLKRLHKILFFLCLYFSLPFGKGWGWAAFAQTNLVPNPSFEITDTCPNDIGQISRAKYWSSYIALSTPDYFNTCSSKPGVYPPNSAAGYQEPLNGNAYAGIVAFDNTGTEPNYREIIGTTLITPLTIGTKYYFSFYVSKGSGQSFALASNKIGIRFFNSSIISSTNLINNFANYYDTTIITDTTNWIQIFGSFIADSTYKYIAIGNFFDDNHTDTLGYSDPSGMGQYPLLSYYYIDNIYLSNDSIYVYNSGVENLNFQQRTLLYPNPTSNKLYIKCVNDIANSIEVYDETGILQKQVINDKKNSALELDTSVLSNGIYLLKINYLNNIEQKKIIINH